MVGESWDVFTKRILIEKHISSIIYENPHIIVRTLHCAQNFFKNAAGAGTASQTFLVATQILVGPTLG